MSIHTDSTVMNQSNSSVRQHLLTICALHSNIALRLYLINTCGSPLFVEGQVTVSKNHGNNRTEKTTMLNISLDVESQTYTGSSL